MRAWFVGFHFRPDEGPSRGQPSSVTFRFGTPRPEKRDAYFFMGDGANGQVAITLTADEIMLCAWAVLKKRAAEIGVEIEPYE